MILRMSADHQPQETSAERREDAKETGRLEAFSDGVFAIAITLLVLNIQIPSTINLASVWDRWPQYLAYVLSFGTILIMWINHHLMLRVIRRTDQLFLVLNGLLLMLITFVNYPTALLAASLADWRAQPEAPKLAALIYNGTFIVTAILFNVCWRYATRNGRLLGKHADRALVATITRQYRYGPLFYAVAFIAALVPIVGPGLSIAIDLALGVYFAFAGYARRVREPAETPVTPG